MSEAMKMRPIEKVVKIIWNHTTYAVPLEIMEQYKIDVDQNMPIDEIFSDSIQKYGEAGCLLKGLRQREGLSQIEFAKKLNINQTNLSAMENGRRVIGKELAKRITSFAGIDYQRFL